MPLLDLLQREPADAPALVFEGVTLSRGELGRARPWHLAARLADAGVGPGCQVLVALPNSPAFLLSLLAVNQCGAVFMPVNPGLAPEERRRIDEIARPDRRHRRRRLDRAAAGPASHADPASSPTTMTTLSGVAAIIFTSGTTGTPKGVMMTEAALLSQRSRRRRLPRPVRARPNPGLPAALLHVYPFAGPEHAGGRRSASCCCETCSTRVLAFAAIAEHAITGFGGVPTSLHILANQAAALGRRQESLRYILSAGGPLHPSARRERPARVPGARAVQQLRLHGDWPPRHGHRLLRPSRQGRDRLAVPSPA